ncbi:MAG: hypothetical protein V4537_06455 [Pseudomonadota bacterium]
MRILAPALLSALLLAGCVRAPEPEPAPQTPIPRPAPRPTPVAPPPSSDWRDWPITPGTWSFRSDARGSIALFGTPGADALLTLRCDRGANAMYLSRAGEGRGTGFTIRTSTTTRALPVQPTGGTPPYMAAVLSPDDRLLDAIGFSRGRFVVEAPPLGSLVVPAWSEILRVIEDCRS